MIYILLLVIAIGLFLSVKQRKKQVLWSVFLLTIMMLLVGMRDETVGVDSPQYAYRFTLVSDFEGLIYEPLYQASVNFINEFTQDYGWWFLFMSFITYLPIGIVICYYSKNPILSVVIYMASMVHLFPENMNIMRQSVAIGLLLLSYFAVIKKNRLFAVLLFLGAVGFHFSSIIVLPFYFICKYSLKKNVIVFVLAITFILGFFSSHLVSLNIINHFFPMMDGIAEVGMEKLSNYETKNALNAFGLIASMLPINLLCYILIPSKSEDDSYKFLFNLFFVGTVISNLIYCAIPFGFRYSYPFFVVESILFAYKFRHDKRLHVFLIFIILYYLYYLTSLSLSERPNMIIPYKLNPMFDLL